MNERIHQKLSLSRITILTSVLVLMFLVSCGPQLKSIRILSAKPVSHTSPASYPTIEEIYQSDDEIFLVSSWGRTQTSKKHLLQWKLYNPGGERLYLTTDRYLIIRRNSFYWNRISLSQKQKNKLDSGMYTVELYLDDKLLKSQDVKYINKSIINPNLNGAVILPFSFDGPGKLSRKSYLNATTNAICGEVKRIVKETVPPAVAEEEIGDDFSPEYLNDPHRMSSVTGVFSEDILITGTLKFEDVEDETNLLTVYVYQSKTGTKKRFMHAEGGAKRYYRLILADLIKGVLYEQGLLEYLRTF
jgi:hypothetical protein